MPALWTAFIPRRTQTSMQRNSNSLSIPSSVSTAAHASPSVPSPPSSLPTTCPTSGRNTSRRTPSTSAADHCQFSPARSYGCAFLFVSDNWTDCVAPSLHSVCSLLVEAQAFRPAKSGSSETRFSAGDNRYDVPRKHNRELECGHFRSLLRYYDKSSRSGVSDCEE